MSSAKELREARHRKILERVGDRLAYITGQVKELPPMEPSAALVSPPGELGLKSLFITGELQSSSEVALYAVAVLFLSPSPLSPLHLRPVPARQGDRPHRRGRLAHALPPDDCTAGPVGV